MRTIAAAVLIFSYWSAFSIIAPRLTSNEWLVSGFVATMVISMVTATVLLVRIK